MNMLTQKSDKFREFQKEFPYSSKYRMFTLASPIVLKNSLKKDVGDADTITGLNGTVSQLVEKFSIEVAKRANFKEIEPVLSLLKGDLKSLLNPSLLEGLLQEGLNRHINKDDDKKEDKKKDPLGGLLDILGGGSKKKTDKDKKRKRCKSNCSDDNSREGDNDGNGKVCATKKTSAMKSGGDFDTNQGGLKPQEDDRTGIVSKIIDHRWNEKLWRLEHQVI